MFHTEGVASTGTLEHEGAWNAARIERILVLGEDRGQITEYI